MGTTDGFKWADYPAHKAKVERLWREKGYSASQIAEEVGRDMRRPLTRGAILGVLNRAGLLKPANALPDGAQRVSTQARAKAAGTEPVMACRAAAAAPRPIATTSVPVTVPVSAAPRPAPRVRLIDNEGCKWPHGNPGSAWFGFCGAAPKDGKPYCAEHCDVAYQPKRATTRAAAADELARTLRRYV